MIDVEEINKEASTIVDQTTIVRTTTEIKIETTIDLISIMGLDLTTDLTTDLAQAITKDQDLTMVQDPIMAQATGRVMNLDQIMVQAILTQPIRRGIIFYPFLVLLAQCHVGI